MALAVGYAVHYINSFKMYFRKTGQRKESIVMGIRDSGWALFFTVITTMAGMLSFLSANIRPMRWVGGITAAAVFAVFVFGLTTLQKLRVVILLPYFSSNGSFGCFVYMNGKQISLDDFCMLYADTNVYLTRVRANEQFYPE